MAKAKQGYLEGQEPPKIAEIENAADDYADIRDKRMALTKDEVKTKGALHMLMDKHKLKRYVLPDAREVIIERGEAKVKVKSAKKAAKKKKKKNTFKTENGEF